MAMAMGDSKYFILMLLTGSNFSYACVRNKIEKDGSCLELEARNRNFIYLLSLKLLNPAVLAG